MSIKDNFNQAIREILKKDGIVGESNTDTPEQAKTELDRYIEPTGGATVPLEDNTVQKNASLQQDIPSPQVTSSYENNEENVANDEYRKAIEDITQARKTNSMPNFGANNPKPVETEYQQPAQKRESIFENVKFNEGSNDETTVISRNTIIEGNIRSFANVTIDGNVKGNVQLTKNAVITGKVVGDLECNNAAMAGSKMQGTITSKGQVKFDRESMILGDVNAQYLDMNGKVKGNIEISGKADFRTDAYIIGDISASTLTVSEGATISGHVNTTFLQENPTAVFPDAIVMND